VRASEARADAIAASPACREGRLSARYLRRLGHALRSRRDAWGRALLAARSGPTYERASRFLPPLFLARAADGRPLTESGVHYTHFSQPESARGASSVALHVADGSQIISRRAHGPRLTIRVGQGGSERYGSCLRRLELPRLADGYLPILQTRYVDGHGVRYEQESFAAHVPETGSLVSFLKLTADATASSARNLRLRFIPSPRGLGSDGSRLLRRGRTYLVFSEGGAYRPPALTYAVPPGGVRTVVVAWLHRPARSRPLLLDELRYEEERENVRRFWERKLAHGGLIVVPEQRVLDAERNLLIQNLGLTWRYSVGNRYEQLSTPEAVDVARVLAAYGHYRVSRAILRTAVRKKPLRPLHPEERRTSWRIGARLVGFADYARLAGDRAEIARALPDLRRYVRRLERQLRASRTGLLPKERFSSDVPDRVYGLHAQAAVWQGLRWIGPVLREAGYPRLAATCARLAARLERGLRRGVRRSERRLPGGALFVPVRLLEDVRPYRSATSSRDGSYWNLVLPYALASGLFPPRGRRAEGVLRYLERHGTRLLGLVRAGAYGLYGTDARGKSGSSPVYGINLSRFLADNDRPDELVLSLYGQLAAGMTPGTFVSGESVSIAPLEGRLYRSAYLPPNGTSNAAFLETLRLLVVHERRDRTGLPRGLELAYATPRGWLRPGRRIEVRRLATSFGRLSYAIDAGAETVEAVVQVPDRAPLGSLRLRLRLPGGKRVAGVLVNGQPGRLLPDGETVELPTRPGELRVEARVG
ncbi:MAG TPA: hypothetical protein VNJ46_10955, partial [Gaiellaceae bacterium]|nr:hypothetical protein [Gaiellaceae bacterium]